MAGRQRYTFTDADVTVEADASAGGGSGGGGGGGGSGGGDTFEMDATQFNEIADRLLHIDTLLYNATIDLESIASNVRSMGSPLVVELVDSQFNVLSAIGGGGVSSVVAIETGQYDGIISGLNAIEGAVYNLNLQTQFGSNNQGGSGGGGGPNPFGLREVLLVELIDTQFNALISGLNSPASKPPVVYPPPPPKMPQWTDILSQFNSGTLLSPKGALGSMAGGKVGVAVQVAETITDTLVKPFQFAKVAIQQLGEAAVRVAKNDGFGLVTQGLDAASDALGKIPVVGKAFAVGLDLASAGLKAFKGTLDAMADRGRELAKYNPQIALASAFADVRKIFADINEANRMAGKYADLIAKQQRVDEEFQKALMPLKEALADLTIKLMPAVSQMARNLGALASYFTGGRENGGTFVDLIRDVSDNTLLVIAEANKNNEKALEAIRKEIERRGEERASQENFWQDMKQAMDDLPIGNRGFDPVDPNARNGIRIPLF